MRFLADECCDFVAVRVLRAHGHDVLAVSEFQHRSVDKDVMDLALAENRILLTRGQGLRLARIRRVDGFTRCDPDPISRPRAEFARGRSFEAGERTCFATGAGLRSLTARGG